MSRRQVSKYSESRSLTSSGSRLSESDVKPTRSANNTETRRRSDCGVARGTPSAAVDWIPGPSAVPHSPQNLNRGSLRLPQLGHTSASAEPHPPQNLRSAGLSVPQVGQIKAEPPARRWRFER